MGLLTISNDFDASEELSPVATPASSESGSGGSNQSIQNSLQVRDSAFDSSVSQALTSIDLEVLNGLGGTSQALQFDLIIREDNFDAVAEIGGQIPSANFEFTIEDPINDPLTVTFDASLTDDAGLTVTYVWDLGDGTQKGGQIFKHTYPDFGTYEVRLTVAATGIIDVNSTKVQDVEIADQLPPARETRQELMRRVPGLHSNTPIYTEHGITPDEEINIQQEQELEAGLQVAIIEYEQVGHWLLRDIRISADCDALVWVLINGLRFGPRKRLHNLQREVLLIDREITVEHEQLIQVVVQNLSTSTNTVRSNLRGRKYRL